MKPTGTVGPAATGCESCDELRKKAKWLQESLDRTERLWSEDRAAVKDWAAASDAIGELYEILGITKDSAGFEDGFKKIVIAVKMQRDEIEDLLAQLAEKEGQNEQLKFRLCRIGEAWRMYDNSMSGADRMNRALVAFLPKEK